VNNLKKEEEVLYVTSNVLHITHYTRLYIMTYFVLPIYETSELLDYGPEWAETCRR
jgi:hypothetical protein